MSSLAAVLVALFAGPAAAESVEWADASADARRPSVTVCDLAGDRRLDLFLAGAVTVDGDRRNAVLVGKDDGFTLDPSHPLAKVPAVNAVLWGDADNDGRTDAFLCRDGPDQLWRHKKDGWANVTASMGVELRDANTVDGAVVDVDDDGDLDLFLAHADGPDSVLTYNRDKKGTYRRLAKKKGLSGGDRPTRDVLASDLDADRDADLVVIHEEPPHEVFENQLLWKYKPFSGLEAFEKTPVESAVAADANVDGRVELYTLNDDGVLRWSPADEGSWKKQPILDGYEATAGRGRLHLLDVDGDGRLDVLFGEGDGFSAATGLASTPKRLDVPSASVVAWSPLVTSAKQGPAIVGARSGEPPLLWRPGSGRHRFAALTFTGKGGKGSKKLESISLDGGGKTHQLRTNASGIGVKAAVRVGSRWTYLDTYPDASGPGQSLQPAPVGLAGAGRIDYVRIFWPDGLRQTTLSLDVGKRHELSVHTLRKKKRQTSSCPMVFAWDGDRRRLLTDVLGVGGIGYNLGAGKYAEPRPWEHLLLPSGSMEPRDGRFEISIPVLLEEAAYVDSVALVAYDLPAGWRMTLNERFATSDPQPTGEPLFYRRSLAPTRAVNDRGEDVTEAIQAADRRPAPPGRPDPRFIGRTKPHTLTLVFDRPLDAWAGDGKGKLYLATHGWIKYPYSQTMFAAWQAGAEYRPPTLEARTDDGEWKTLQKRFGYPAGMPHRVMTVPIPQSKLPDGTKALRLRTNMEIYWDRARVVWAEPCPAAERRTLPLTAATLEEIGFPRRTGPEEPGRFDYSDRVPFSDMRPLPGEYTRFGSVQPLVREADEALAIYGPGEALQLRFAVPKASPPADGRRRFVLEATGWCKDMDLYTKHGDRLKPIPQRADATEEELARRRRLHAKYNTRYEAAP